MIRQQSYTLSNSFKRKKYLKYDEGDTIDSEIVSTLMGKSGASSVGGGVPWGAIAAQTNGVLDAFDSGNEFGRQSTGVTTVKGALSGASAGMMFGPIGAGIGAVVGGAAGLISGNKEKEQKISLKKIEIYGKNRQKLITWQLN